MNRLIKKLKTLEINDSEYNDMFIIEVSSEEEEEDITSSKGTLAKQTNILSIDIGIKHLGISVMEIDKEFNNPSITHIDLIDITDFKHKNKQEEKQCKLHHTKTLHDRLEHVFFNHYYLFNTANFILIERQPLSGLTNVEQIIFGKFRDKAILISPNAMHSYFMLSDEYEQRKIETTEIAFQNIKVQSLLKKFSSYDRKHDIADSICIALFWINLKKNERIKQDEELKKLKLRQNLVLKFNKQNMTMEEWFDQFKYNPS